jgi:hypothetical protein
MIGNQKIPKQAVAKDQQISERTDQDAFSAERL